MEMAQRKVSQRYVFIECRGVVTKMECMQVKEYIEWIGILNGVVY